MSLALSFVAIAISLPLLIYNGYWMLKNRDMVRRFLKLIVTGKYEPPKRSD